MRGSSSLEEVPSETWCYPQAHCGVTITKPGFAGRRTTFGPRPGSVFETVDLAFTSMDFMENFSELRGKRERER